MATAKKRAKSNAKNKAGQKKTATKVAKTSSGKSATKKVATKPLATKKSVSKNTTAKKPVPEKKVSNKKATTSAVKAKSSKKQKNKKSKIKSKPDASPDAQKKLASRHIWELVEAKKRNAAKTPAWQAIAHHDHPAPRGGQEHGGDQSSAGSTHIEMPGHRDRGTG